MHFSHLVVAGLLSFCFATQALAAEGSPPPSDVPCQPDVPCQYGYEPILDSYIHQPPTPPSTPELINLAYENAAGQLRDIEANLTTSAYKVTDNGVLVATGTLSAEDTAVLAEIAAASNAKFIFCRTHPGVQAICIGIAIVIGEIIGNDISDSLEHKRECDRLNALAWSSLANDMAQCLAQEAKDGVKREFHVLTEPDPTVCGSQGSGVCVP